MKQIPKPLFPLFLTACLLMALLTGCSENDCPMSSRAYVRYNFLPLNPFNASEVVELDSLTVTSLGTDSILINRESKVRSMSLPLSFAANETTFILHYTKALSDTLRVIHTSTDHFLSLECGVAVYQRIDSIKHTRNLIKGIKIMNREIDLNEKENVQLLF